MKLAIELFAFLMMWNVSASTVAPECSQNSLSLQMTLGSQKTVMVQRVSSDSHFVFNLSALEAVDPQAWVTVTEDIFPASHELEGRLLVSVPYSSPSFEKIVIAVQELDESQTLLNVTRLELEVAPVLNIHFYGEQKGVTVFESPDTIQLQPHDKPVTVRFVNVRDNGTSHRIHAEGAIPHAPRGTSLLKVGDAYEAQVEAKTQVSASYYCHDHDTSLDQKKIKFNVLNLQELRGAVQFPDAVIH